MSSSAVSRIKLRVDVSGYFFSRLLEMFFMCSLLGTIGCVGGSISCELLGLRWNTLRPLRMPYSLLICIESSNWKMPLFFSTECIFCSLNTHCTFLLRAVMLKIWMFMFSRFGDGSFSRSFDDFPLSYRLCIMLTIIIMGFI
jgi:hypothetical protein